MSASEGLDNGAAVPADEGVGSSGAGSTEAIPSASDELQTVYFEYDSYRLSSAGRSAVSGAAQWLKANGKATVQIEGHCDERGSTEYNLALGDRRANVIRDALAREGIAPNRLSTLSYGEERAADPGHNETAWARNRRGQFVVLSK